MKKILSISLYGDVKYLNKILKNFDLFLNIFHDFEFYFYVDNKFNGILEKSIPLNNVKIFYRNQLSHSDGMFWRFEPIINGIGDLCLVRDADYLPTTFERNLINKFIDSKFNFHILRTHNRHRMPILGGLFGIKKKSYSIFKNGYYKWKKSHLFSKIYYNDDQLFLAKYVYCKVLSSSKIHTTNVVFFGEEYEFINYSTDIIIGGDTLYSINDLKKKEISYFLPVKFLNITKFKYFTKPIYTKHIS